MILSLFFTIGIIITKLVLFLAAEEAEIVGVFNGDESLIEAAWNTRNIIVNLFFGQIPFAMTVAVSAFHIFSIV